MENTEKKSEPTGVKFDDGKLRWDLLPYPALSEVTSVFTYGAKKYGDRNWEKGIARNRLFAACMRHLVAYLENPEWPVDEESGELHLAHAAANLLMCLHLDLQYKK